MPESSEEMQRSKTVWDYKPWWCQPWSILLTGTGLIAASWFLLHNRWITGFVAVPLLLWMGFFLVIYPQLVAESGLLDREIASDENRSS
jgi:hypothetical protein